MKHPSNRAFFEYWDSKRGDAPAPDRSEFDPDAVRELLGDIFVLAFEVADGFPFRVAGTRVCALLGRDAKGHSFPGLFASGSRAEITDILTIVGEESQPAIAGITARAADGTPAPLELLLLPFSARSHAPLSLTGLLAPFDSPVGPMADFTLTSWRYLSPRPKPRAVRRWSAVRGFMVYEGLR